ncbi:NAD(P)/FAD-dependent oxidoreductase [Bosea sp. AS-1]|uniref:NAD(P)/FAD-dependent oxidoreductase n=1 Tax=Bosea sp. AS-1 TaxID=2015316 RepID=UPI000B7878F8|nr:NAD(P)/FAD-dependent oxidoreductase [Bosea sp. AS-1]
MSVLSPSPPELFDCLIIGGGPAGLTAAIYLARFHLSALVVDAGDGRAAMIPTTHNHAGFPAGISGVELLSRMRAQATKYGVVFETGMIASLDVADDGTFIASSSERPILAQTVLLASGVFNRRPQGLSESLHDEAVQRGLLRYCPICDGYEVTDRSVAVIGTGQSGLAEAEFLRSYTANVSLIAPDGEHRLDDEERARADAAGVKLLAGPCLAYSLHSEWIEVSMPGGPGAFSSIYAALGTMARSELAIAIGARATKNGCPIVDPHQRTSVKGLYAAGDLVLGLDQISHAMGQAGVAATTIRNDLAKISPLRR